jgi:membrane protease YdiL (CAAX protease family)
MERSSLLSHMSPFSKFLFLITIAFTTYLATVFIGFLAGIPFFGSSFYTQLGNIDSNDPANLPLLKYFQIISQLGFFIFPALIYSYLMGRQVTSYLFIDKNPDWVTALLVCILLILSMPAINWLIELNGRLQLPSSLKDIDDWMKKSEQDAASVTSLFLSNSSWGGFLVNILMMVLLPAIGEEFIFRGVLIRIFREWTGNIHWAVVLSALFFSAMHFQFFGFIPRMVLGLLLGYVFVWSANLWMPIIMHLINNAFTVVAAFLIERGYLDVKLDELDSQPVFWEVGLSVLMSLSLLWIIFQRQKKIREL